MSVEAAAQDRVKCLLTIKRTSAHHRVKPPLTITEMRMQFKAPSRRHGFSVGSLARDPRFSKLGFD
jgi:hypothetical protein